MRFLIGHSRGRLIDEEYFWILREQHADFQPLLFTVRQQSGFSVSLRIETDQLQDLVELIALRRGEPTKQRGEHAARAVLRQNEIIPDRVFRVHAWSLKLSADA